MQWCLSVLKTKNLNWNNVSATGEMSWRNGTSLTRSDNGNMRLSICFNVTLFAPSIDLAGVVNYLLFYLARPLHLYCAGIREECYSNNIPNKNILHVHYPTGKISVHDLGVLLFLIIFCRTMHFVHISVHYCEHFTYCYCFLIVISAGWRMKELSRRSGVRARGIRYVV